MINYPFIHVPSISTVCPPFSPKISGSNFSARQLPKSSGSSVPGIHVLRQGAIKRLNKKMVVQITKIPHCSNRWKMFLEIHIIHIWFAEKGLVQWVSLIPIYTCEAYLNACYQKHVSISSSRRKLGPLCFLGPHDIPAVMRHFQNIKTSENIRIFDLAKLLLAKVAWNLPKNMTDMSLSFIPYQSHLQ